MVAYTEGKKIVAAYSEGIQIYYNPSEIATLLEKVDPSASGYAGTVYTTNRTDLPLLADGVEVWDWTGGNYTRTFDQTFRNLSQSGSVPILEKWRALYVIGDSNSQTGYSNAVWHERAVAALGWKYQTPPLSNVAYAGRASDYAARQISVMQGGWDIYGKGVVAYAHGYNGSATTADDARAVFDAVLAYGHKLLWIYPPTFTGAYSEMMPLLDEYGSDPNVAIVRSDAFLSNTGANLEGNDKGDTVDGVHLNDRGHDKVSDACIPFLEAWANGTAVPYESPDVAVAAMTGTSGLVYAGGTGQIFNGWEGSKYSGSGTVVYSTGSDGSGPYLDITMDGTAGATRALVVSPVSLPYAAGAHLSGLMTAQLLSGEANEFTTFTPFYETTGLSGRTMTLPVETRDYIDSQTLPLYKGSSGTFTDLRTLYGVNSGKTAVIRVRKLGVQAITLPDYAPQTSLYGLFTEITGTPKSGVSTALTERWEAKPAISSTTYQWKIAGVDIGGATAATYTPVAGDVGKQLTCLITATNSVGSTSWLPDGKNVTA